MSEEEKYEGAEGGPLFENPPTLPEIEAFHELV
jgi:hypothetical protein